MLILLIIITAIDFGFLAPITAIVYICYFFFKLRISKLVNWPLILLDSVSLDIFFNFDNLRFNIFFNVSFYKIILFHLKFETDQKKLVHHL